jgi:hypothetical protein
VRIEHLLYRIDLDLVQLSVVRQYSTIFRVSSHISLETEVAQEEGRAGLVLLPLSDLLGRLGHALPRFDRHVSGGSSVKVVGVLDQKPPAVEMALAEFDSGLDLVGVCEIDIGKSDGIKSQTYVLCKGKRE